jgi:hypothetical protein
MQTHLLKLDPPYRFIFDEKNGRVGKVIAVLLRPNEDKDSLDYGRTVSVPIVDLAYTWDATDLADCRILCDEFRPRISFEMYIDCLMSVKSNMWFPNGFFSVYYFSSQLNDLGIRVLFPSEGEKEGEHEVIMKTKLHMGVDEQGVYWVENGFGGFYFGGRYESKEKLYDAILERRNDYYRSFPQKRFIIRLRTDNPEFQPMLDDINNTPYDRDE